MPKWNWSCRLWQSWNFQKLCRYQHCYKHRRSTTICNNTRQSIPFVLQRFPCTTFKQYIPIGCQVFYFFYNIFHLKLNINQTLHWFIGTKCVFQLHFIVPYQEWEIGVKRIAFGTHRIVQNLYAIARTFSKYILK